VCSFPAVFFLSESGEINLARARARSDDANPTPFILFFNSKQRATQQQRQVDRVAISTPPEEKQFLQQQSGGGKQRKENVTSFSSFSTQRREKALLGKKEGEEEGVPSSSLGKEGNRRDGEIFLAAAAAVTTTTTTTGKKREEEEEKQNREQQQLVGIAEGGGVAQEKSKNENKNERDEKKRSGKKAAAATVSTKKRGVAAAATATAGTNTTKTTTNEEGHFEYTLGESLGPNNRFKILAPLGEGTFGKVLECYDRVKQEYCAVKVIRNVPKYKAAAKIEVDVLREIGRRDERDEFHCIRLKESFEHEGHACLMFDMYGLSLFDFMKKNHYKPFSLALVQKFAKQLIKAVAFMHELKMTHTDLKPENVLLETPGYVRVVSSADVNANNAANAAVGTSACTMKVPVTSAIKLIDFGSTTLEDQYHSTVVSTRHYRAPEIILGTGWSYPCDMWSIGCILIELLTGDALFQTHENMEHLAMMRNVLGHMHADVIKRSSKETIEKYFNPETHELRWPECAKDVESERAVQAVQPLDIMIRERFECEETGTLLRHLLSRLLEYDPDTRITARDALNHGFFRLDIKENVYTPVTAFVGNQTSVANAAKQTTDRTASSVVRNVAPTNSKARSQTTGGIRGTCLDKPSMATEIVLGA